MAHVGREPSPSRWAERVPLAVAAAAGAAIAAYLALVQVGVVAQPWDPVFGAASAMRVLRSGLSRALPVPDAALGAAAYLGEAVLALVGGEERWRDRAGVVLAYGALVGLLAAGSAVLVLVQVAVIRSGCAPCLLSAAISMVIAVVAQREVRAAVAGLRRTRARVHA